MRAAPVTVGGVPSRTLPCRLPVVLALVCVLALLVGPAYSGPGAQQKQTAQGTTLTADEFKMLRQKAEQGNAMVQCYLVSRPI